MRKMTGISNDSGALERYAEQSLRENIFDRDSFWRVLWAGSPYAGETGYVPPPVPWRKRAWRAVCTFVWAHAPRVHIGPCCTECWEC